VLIEVVVLLLLARSIEPYYGTKEFLRFLIFVDFTTCLATFVTVCLAFVVTRDVEGSTVLL
jgi:Eukaryotic integral membrane protein (DUF1751)